MSTETRTKIMLVDDHSIVRELLAETLEQSGEFEVVGQAADGEEAVQVVEDIRPDLVIMDVIMPRKDGIDACREIMDKLPETRVVMLTAANDNDALLQSLAAGATGYLQKYSGKQRLMSTLRGVSEGELRLPAAAAKSLVAGLSGSGRVDDEATHGLTEKQLEILKLFSEGLSYAEIAEISGRTKLTVRNNVYQIQDKLGIKSKQGIVVWAVRNGLLDDYTTDVAGRANT